MSFAASFSESFCVFRRLSSSFRSSVRCCSIAFVFSANAVRSCVALVRGRSTERLIPSSPHLHSCALLVHEGATRSHQTREHCHAPSAPLLSSSKVRSPSLKYPKHAELDICVDRLEIDRLTIRLERFFSVSPNFSIAFAARSRF